MNRTYIVAVAAAVLLVASAAAAEVQDRKSTRLNSSHSS